MRGKMLCQCGCGRKVKLGNEYINGHNKSTLGKKHSEETKKRIGEASKGRIVSKETRQKISLVLKGKNKGKKFTEEHKRKISLGNRGKVVSEETKRKLSEAGEGRVFSEKTRERMSEGKKGNTNAFKHGKSFILNQHKNYKKQECLFECESAKRYNIHHEPPIQENILEWEGRLVNLCTNCHKKVHAKTLELPDNVGIKWTRKDTEKLLREIINVY